MIKELFSRNKPAPAARTDNRPRIHELFEAQAQKTPEAIAVTCGAEKLTYRELNERANQLANFLRESGVKSETPVALYLERSMEMVVAIVGVLKSGGAYVPVDLAYPKDRLGFMLDDARAPILLTQERLRGSLPSQAPKIICLDSDWNQIAAQPSTNFRLSAPHTADSAAYIIYTSGSTGKPKGVLVTHHNVVRLLQQTEHWYQFNSSDVWPLFHSYAFDVSVFELWGCFFYGGRLVIVPYLISRSPNDFYELLERERVTVLNQTPSAFRQLIWADTAAEKKRNLCLRYVICAGEALELQSLKPWFDLHGDQEPRIVNMYGITEITVHATYRVIRQEDLTNGNGSVIGVPIPDLQIYLVDDDLKPVPNGTPGEICVGGAGVARGYLNRPELNQHRFVADPFSDEPGARMYRSGDLAQINPKGEMEYLGRMDHQVKIRGFRVELGEIESALNRHPAVRGSAVLAQDDPTSGKRLIAYLVPNKSVSENLGNGNQHVPTVTELREYLNRTLPDYMVPANFMFLDSLPLTTNGKLDRRALPSPDGSRPELKSEFVGASSEIEKSLTAIWSEVLEIGRIGVNDNFFELGGDSIRSISILSRAQQKGIHLTLEQVFQHPTIAALAACASASGRKTPTPQTKPFSLLNPEDRPKLPDDIEDAYPLTRLQLGMFYHNELNPVSAMYHDVFSFRIQAAFERDKIEQAIEQLAQRHPVMRTSFHLAGYSEPLQLVHRKLPVPLTVEDLRAQSNQQQNTRLAEWIEWEKRNPFDRSAGPMFRFHAQLRDEKSFQFIISFHHGCLDGWSLAAVMTELFQDYAALLRGAEAKIEAPRITYRDFVALEQQAIASEQCRQFWREKLKDAAPQLLPRWPKEYRTGGHEQNRGPELHLDAGVLAGLKNLAQSAGVPLKTVLLAAHQRVMAELYGQNDVLSGLICNGRPEEVDGEKLIGLFLNTVPLRQSLTGGTWLQLVKHTFAAEQELMPHRRFPLAEVQKLVGGQPVLETAFDFVHFHVYKRLEGSQGLDLAEGHYFEANNLTTYTTFMLDVTSTKLELHIDYDPNLIARAQVEQMSEYYVRTLKAMVADPNARYENFSPLSDAETRQLLVEWNSTQADYPRDKRVEQLFEERALETPNALAVRCGKQELTYRELNERARRIATKLREIGVGAEDLVGICTERSPDMLAALLGIMKAGAAYVPLDPTYPKDRLAFMLEDSQLRVLLTQNALIEGLPKSSAQVVCLESIVAEPQSGVTDTQSSSSIPARDSLAYVIYTSGSTGKPKGVLVNHGSVVNLLLSAGNTIGFSSKDNLLAVTTLSFDIAGLELFLPLIKGAQLTLATREEASDGNRLANLLKDANATVMQGTPATWRLLIEAGWSGKQDLRILCGGESLKRSLAVELLKRAQAVWNFYGPTETTIWSTAGKVEHEENVPIGRPLANTQLYILDQHLHPVPLGAAGELHIGGDGLARGYLNRPELTAEKFIPNPFSKQANSRLYKTGDLARYLPDGRVECLGRSDHQVKVRGFRIELGEIETVLRQHQGIADVLVTAREDSLGEKRLVGYIISRNGPPAISELRDFVKTKLPMYMVPAHFVTIQQFPLTPNGKVDVRRLPAPESSGVASSNYVAPRTEDEKTLAQIWQEVLMVKQMGINDNFFELGGDSLSATRAFARINRTFGTALTLREMMDHPTISSLAGLVGVNKGRAARPVKPIIPRPRMAGI